MTRLLRDVRLVPIVLIAIICLFALKSFGLIFDGGYTLNEPPPAVDPNDLAVGWVGAQRDRDRAAVPKSVPKQSWAQRMFNYPDITGSVPQGNSSADALTKSTVRPTEQGAGSKQMSVAERAILERLSERRSELDARAKDLDMRENLLKAAEKRLEGRINELKELEARVNTAMQTKTDGEAARFKNLVTMYESMKAKEAAKIFDRLDMRVLIEVATQINPRRMSDILAQMTPEAAEKLTIELAIRAKDNKAATAELPKIEGRPAN
jgi:flagellar motility protein MotE (MotC chaperone)